MKKKNLTFSAKRIVRRVRDASALAFDTGITMRVAAETRRRLSSLSLRCAGVFLFTLGIYSAVITLVKMLVWEQDPIVSITASVLCALSAVPLMLSSSTLGESLVKTKTGRTILGFAGIREESVKVKEPFGRANIAFILGVAAGTLTFLAPTGAILMGVLLLILCGVVLTVPESAVMFASVFIPLGMDLPCAVLSWVGMISFAIKYLRYKRYAVGFSHDKAAGVMLLSVVLGVLVSVGGAGSSSYIALLSMYFIASLSPSGRALGGKLMATLVAAGGLSAAIFEVFAVIAFAAAKGKLSTAQAVDGIAVCDVNAMSLVACALIPAAMFILISGGALSRVTAFLCAASMTAFLIISQGYVYLVAAVVGTVAAMMFCNKHLGFLVISLGIFSTVAWVWMGKDLMAIPELIKSLLLRPEDMATQSYDYFLFGEGLTGGFGHGGSFYMAVMSRLGIVGIAVLLAFGILLAAELIALERKSKKAANKVYKNACVPLCSIISLLMCGVSVNIWESSEGFLLFWILCGAAGACIAGGNRRADKLIEADAGEKSKNAAGVIVK